MLFSTTLNQEFSRFLSKHYFGFYSNFNVIYHNSFLVMIHVYYIILHTQVWSRFKMFVSLFICMQAMLWFIYTGYLLEDQQISQGPAILESFLGKMLEAAHRFELGSLKRICESRMVDGMCLESVAYVLHLAHRNNATQLKAACLDFAVEHLSGNVYFLIS